MAFPRVAKSPVWKKEWNRANDVVWQMLKVTTILDDHKLESKDELFFTPLNNLSHLLFCKEAPSYSIVSGTDQLLSPIQTERLLRLHNNIVGQLIDLKADFNSCICDHRENHGQNVYFVKTCANTLESSFEYPKPNLL